MPILFTSPSGNDNRTLERKLLQQLNYLFLFCTCQPVMEGQSDQLVAGTLRHRAVADFSAEALSHFREMQRQIMKDAVYTPFP